LLAAGRPADAISEFNKIITHRGLLMVDPLDAIARLQLARRAYTKMGHIANPKAAYADLFSYGRRLDRDLPAVIQARGEFAKLHCVRSNEPSFDVRFKAILTLIPVNRSPTGLEVAARFLSEHQIDRRRGCSPECNRPDRRSAGGYAAITSR
jgi:hypothetical protein